MQKKFAYRDSTFRITFLPALLKYSQGAASSHCSRTDKNRARPISRIGRRSYRIRESYVVRSRIHINLRKTPRGHADVAESASLSVQQRVPRRVSFPRPARAYYRKARRRGVTENFALSISLLKDASDNPVYARERYQDL